MHLNGHTFIKISGMTLWVKAFATKPNNLSLFPVTNDIERENRLCKLSSGCYNAVACVHPQYVYYINKMHLINK